MAEVPATGTASSDPLTQIFQAGLSLGTAWGKKALDLNTAPQAQQAASGADVTQSKQDAKWSWQTVALIAAGVLAVLLVAKMALRR
jgi:hypothetical protein